MSSVSLAESWWIVEGDGPILATAIHSGHGLRPEVASLMVLPEPERLREEDPYTDLWTPVGETRIVALRSRFEVDVNRPREKAVYVRPEDAWGLQVWRDEPSAELIERSLGQYDAFYAAVRDIVAGLESRHGALVVLDLHSYNHRRDGATAAPAAPSDNPEVNVGTGSMDRGRWADVVESFMSVLGAQDVHGRQLDVRENVKFRGGHFSGWLHETFPTSVCCLAIEFKKFFMDEWTGELDPSESQAIGDALAPAVDAVREALRVRSG